jgi:hypothetical protein
MRSNKRMWATTRRLTPIAGLIAFYDEKVGVYLDGEPQPRPTTHFGK